MNIDDKYIFNQEGQDKWVLTVKSNTSIFGVIEKEYTKTKSKSVFSIKYFWNKVFQDKLYADDIEQAKDKLIDVLNKAENQVKHIQTFEGFINENKGKFVKASKDKEWELYFDTQNQKYVVYRNGKEFVRKDRKKDVESYLD